jgi:hypothetical protein
MKKNPCLDVALQELGAAGIRDIERSYGSKHVQVRWRANGHGMRMYSMAATPSDIRSTANVRAGIRRILREDGMLPIVEHKTPAPRPPDRVTLLERDVVDLKQRLADLEEIIKGRVV